MQRLDVNIVRVHNDCLSVCKNPVNKAHKVLKILEIEEFFILSSLRTRKNGTPNYKSNCNNAGYHPYHFSSIKQMI